MTVLRRIGPRGHLKLTKSEKYLSPTGFPSSLRLGDTPDSRSARHAAVPCRQRPDIVRVRVHQAALARARCQSAIWRCWRSRATTAAMGRHSSAPWITALPTGGRYDRHIQRRGVHAARTGAPADDRAPMGRLIRFVQTRDLLKTSARRAQKLAQDNNAGLETYQLLVWTLEEQLVRSDGLYVLPSCGLFKSFNACLDWKRLTSGEACGRQVETLRQLREANTTQSSRALQFAEDVGAAYSQATRIGARAGTAARFTRGD